MDCSFRKKVELRHKFNSTEKVVGDRRLKLDCFNAADHVVYEFHGCYWHGHDPCALTASCKGFNTSADKSFKELDEGTRERTRYLREELGFKVVEMRECEWKQMKRDNVKLIGS